MSESNRTREPRAPAVERRRARRTTNSAVLMALVAIAAGIVTLSAIGALLVVHLNMPFLRPMRNAPPAAVAIFEEFLIAADAEDAEYAYALISPSWRSYLYLGEMEEYLYRTGRYGRFDGYESLSIDRAIYFSRADFSSDFRLRRLWLDGEIVYKNAPDTTFIAIMELVDGVWTLDSLYLYSLHRWVYDEFYEL